MKRARFANNAILALRSAEQTWYKSWQPRVLSANGRQFFHQLDDVKDHEPDRTVDLSYLVYRQLLLPFDDWYENVRAARNSYASRNRSASAERFSRLEESGFRSRNLTDLIPCPAKLNSIQDCG